MEYIRITLSKEQIAKVIEMIKYVFPEGLVSSTDGSNYLISFTDSNQSCRTYISYHLFEVLVYIIPRKLEMDFVVVDPHDIKNLYSQIVDRFERLNDKEESVPKTVVHYGYGEGCWDNC
jgi:hypothetical protein